MDGECMSRCVEVECKRHAEEDANEVKRWDGRVED